MAILLIGFALISAILVAQAVVARSLTSSTESQSRRLERDSVLSVEALSRIALATDQLRLLVDDRISATNAAVTADIDTRLEAATQDVDRASYDYGKLVDFPAEASEWQQVRGPLAPAGHDQRRASLVARTPGRRSTSKVGGGAHRIPERQSHARDLDRDEQDKR